MSDNAIVKSDATTTLFTVAADQVTFSGDTAYVQLFRPVHVGGSEGSKVNFDLTDATGMAVHVIPKTTGGTTPYHVVSAGSNNAAVVKASAGQLYGVHVFNLAAYPIYVKLYNKATTPAPASDTPFLTFGVQAGTHRDPPIVHGIAFGTGISIAIVKGIADNNNTAVVASDCVVDLEYT